MPFGGDFTAKELTEIQDTLQYGLSEKATTEYNGLLDMLRPVVIKMADTVYGVELKEAERAAAKTVKTDSKEPALLKEMIARQEITKINDDEEITVLTHNLARAIQSEVIPIMMNRAKGNYTDDKLPRITSTDNPNNYDVIDVSASPLLYDVIIEYLKNKESDKLASGSIRNYEIALNHLKAISENIPICMFDFKVMRQVRDKAKQRVKAKGLKSSYIKTLQSNIRMFFTDSRKNGFDFPLGIEQIFDIRPKGLTTTKEEKEKTGFTDEQLQIIFNKKNYRFKSGVGAEARYWLPLIALFQGMRLNEIAPLTTNDIKTDENGIAYIHVGNSANTKNLQSVRKIPIMSQLVQLGFLDYVEHKRQGKKIELFEAPKRNKDVYSSSFFSRKLTLLGIKEDEKHIMSFHSLRHTFATKAYKAGILETLVQNFLGQKQTGNTMKKHYIDKADVKELYEAFKDLSFPIDIEAIKRDWTKTNTFNIH